VAPAASLPVPDGPVEELLLRFRRYLEQERGLVPAAARGYVDYADLWVTPMLRRAARFGGDFAAPGSA
jgi:hypothetical protein